MMREKTIPLLTFGDDFERPDLVDNDLVAGRLMENRLPPTPVCE